MINVNSFFPGTTFKFKDTVYVVVESKHLKSARGQAKVKAKVRDIKSEAVVTLSFIGGSYVEQAFIKRKIYQFMYQQQGSCFFMDMETYETKQINSNLIGKNTHLLIEGDEYQATFYENYFISLIFPDKVPVTVTYTEDGLKGNTIGRATKKATVNNQLTVDVPLFIKKGEKILISAKTHEYAGRSN